MDSEYASAFPWTNTWTRTTTFTGTFLRNLHPKRNGARKNFRYYCTTLVLVVLEQGQ